MDKAGLMTYKGLWRTTLAVVASILLAACDTGNQGTPAIGFDIPGGAESIITSDSSINLAGTATSQHEIDLVAWNSDRGGSGFAQGGENWQIYNIDLAAGDNVITVTASDTAGNSNSRNVRITRETARSGQANDTAGAGISSPVLMYSYHHDLRNAAPADGAKIDVGDVHFYVVPSDSWRAGGIEHMAYYCCDEAGSDNDSSSKLAVSREPWSMIIDLSEFAPGDRRSIDIEANLANGTVLTAQDFDFTLTSASASVNRAPTIGGNPATEVAAGSAYDFQPDASDADSDTLSFSIDSQPPWTNFDPLTGRLWGTPSSGDIGMYGGIVISVSDGKSSVSMPPFSIDVSAGQQGAAPPPPAPPAASAPVINSFTSSKSAITAGESVTLRWSVDNSTSISISPNPGAVSGSSVQMSPTKSTTYTLTATNNTGSSTKSVFVSVLAGQSDWQVSEAPPVLSSPKVVNVSALTPVNIPAIGITCAGKVYKINFNDGQDGVVYMSGSQPLRYPVRITGGRNVRVVGLDFSLVTQPGCGIGELPNLPADQHPNASIHPRVPGAIALRIQQSGVTFVEGLHIDVQGHEADCIVSRNPDSMSESQARKQRDVIIQNLHCSGVEGLGESDIGDGVHGDLFQNQGRDPLRRLVFENVSMRTSQEGIVLHGGISGPGTQSLVVRRYDYTWDARFVGDDAYDHRFGLAFVGWPSSDWTLESIYIDDYRDGGDYLKIDNQRYGSFSSNSVLKHPEIHSGLPPQGAFALPERTGIHYTSPHGGVP